MKQFHSGNAAVAPALGALVSSYARTGTDIEAVQPLWHSQSVNFLPVPVLAERTRESGKLEAREATDSPSNTNPNGTRGGQESPVPTDTGAQSFVCEASGCVPSPKMNP